MSNAFRKSKGGASKQFADNSWFVGVTPRRNPEIVVAVLFALGIGYLNGYLVLRTGLPSFIVTLGSLFILRGLTIGLTSAITGRTQVGGLDAAPGYSSALAIFASDIQIGGVGFSIEILWWLAIAALATWVLLRTTFGNWIFGVGGDVNGRAAFDDGHGCESSGVAPPRQWPLRRGRPLAGRCRRLPKCHDGRAISDQTFWLRLC